MGHEKGQIVLDATMNYGVLQMGENRNDQNGVKLILKNGATLGVTRPVTEMPINYSH